VVVRAVNCDPRAGVQASGLFQIADSAEACMVYYNKQMTQSGRTMKYCITPEVFRMFPDFHRGVVVAVNAKNGPSDPEILSSLRELEEKIKNDHLDLASDPRLKIWEDAYVKFGSNPKRYTPSIIFLVSRIKEGKSIRSISSIVDLFNIISLRYLVPCGGDDVDTVEGDLTLGIATGKEISHLFSSPTP